MKRPANMSRASSGAGGTKDGAQVCNFCAKTPAAVSVSLPVLGRKKRAPTGYCLVCYYTTSAVRQDPTKHVCLLDAEQHQLQLPTIQELFSECFLELQQELAEESTRAFSRQRKDPLAMLSASSNSKNNNNKKRRKTSLHNKGQAPDLFRKQEGKATDGGFLREIGLPERLKRTQQEQERLQHEQLARMNQAASAARRASRTTNTSSSSSTIAQRRKGSGKSIWNLAMGNSKKIVSYKESSANNLHSIACTCGSKDVQSFGNITSRNQEVRKGEIWGTDRGEEVINRYQCNKCGRTWNEVE